MTRHTVRQHLVGLGLFVAAGIAFPFLFPGYQALAISLLLFAGWATAWDILGGWAGQVSLGHAAFVGIGAYAVGLGATNWGVAPWWTLLVGMALAALLALLWGALTFGLRGSYFVLSTIAIAEILRLIAINWRSFTGGAQGIFIYALPEPFGLDLFSRRTEYYLALVYVALLIGLVIYLSKSRFGYRMRAVREDEESAMAAGINPRSVKLAAFALSGALTAAGGSVYALFLSYLEPHDIFFLPLSVRIALIAIIGGRGTIWGPLAGAALITVSAEVFRTAFAQANLLIFGVLIVVVVLFLPKGVIGELTDQLKRRRYARGTQG